MDNEAPQSPVELAVKEGGGTVALAKRLGITSQAISQWDRIPAERVLEVERVTGIPRHKLRPDIYPPAREPATAPEAAA